jgi:16S rRNA (cytidine1402-2'-O)-methyltransferase
VAALAASGIASEEFVFIGFLPARAGDRRKRLAGLAGESRTIILYEAPHRIEETLADASELLGSRPAVIAREVTKLHEEFLRGQLPELLDYVRKKPARGEITLVIGPGVPSLPAAQTNLSLTDRVAEIMREQTADHKAALKQAARERGLNKREAYRQLLVERR